MLKQSLNLKQLQKLSPQQIQLMKLIQLPTTALEQRIKEEIEENPALDEGEEEPEEEVSADEDEEITDDSEEETEDDEIDIEEYMIDDEIPDYKTRVNNNSPDEERKTAPVVFSASFQDNLLSQIGMCDFDDRDEQIAIQIIGSFDDDGYLRRPMSQIANDLAFAQNISATEKELEAILNTIQTFDPPGVGARDLRECLLLQMKRRDQHLEEIRMATEILENFFNEFSHKHYDKIIREMPISEEKLKVAMHEILKLNPKPGDTYADSQKSMQHVIPDFMLLNTDGKLEVVLNSRNMPELRVSNAYKEMLDHYVKSKKHTKSDKEAISFVKQKIDSAQWFIDALNERQQTLLRTMNAILDKQQEYFMEGDETKLKPMVLKDIAAVTGYDISTISRVSNSKYIQTPFGTFPVKYFFSESLKTEAGEDVSSREVKRILQDCIAGEDKSNPLTDEQLMAELKNKGYQIARRTIAKYREMLNIPVARMRREL